MIISDFMVSELDYFRDKCNFVNLEISVFEKRAKGIPLEQIAEELNISYDYARQIRRESKISIIFYIKCVYNYIFMCYNIHEVKRKEINKNDTFSHITTGNRKMVEKIR